MGKYVKASGGSTPNLQEAQVVGWTKAGLKRWQYPSRVYVNGIATDETYCPYELIPVTITLC
jgi:hypothetical protein